MQLKFFYGMFARRCKVCPQCNDEFITTFYKDIKVLCALRVLTAALSIVMLPFGNNSMDSPRTSPTCMESTKLGASFGTVRICLKYTTHESKYVRMTFESYLIERCCFLSSACSHVPRM
jgi:hypothetical protein